jgi:hypothetical protein
MRCCWAHGARDYDKAQEPHSRAEATRSPLGVKQMPNRFNDRGVRSEVSVSRPGLDQFEERKYHYHRQAYGGGWPA